MKVQTNPSPQATASQQHAQQDQHHKKYICSTTRPMEGIITQQEMNDQEQHRVITSFNTKDKQSMEGTTTKECTSQTKRQRTEDTIRAGHAMQASPRK
ncbi:hypothetical protein P8452_03906 [Trifolium repens]|nr:hypothetical protein P8452_03906 [Trifolium repens]